MTDSIQITASLRIDRPASEVRAQYRDIDHHIRNNVHPSIRYQWEPAEPGQRKIRTTFRILGVPQFDVSLLEDGEDGSFVIRYLEGSNAGMVLVHEFVPIGPDSTDVRLSADAPATLGRKLLGPLFVAGARQVMKKALAEDKRDLERGTFKPGVAAGNLERALHDLGEIALASNGPRAKRAVLEAACLVSAADGEIDLAERDAIGRLTGILRAPIELEWAGTRLTELARIAATDRIAGEADRVGQDLRAENVAVPGLRAGAVVGLVSGGMSLGELSVLRRIAAAAEVPEESLGPMIAAADAALDSAQG
jgi:tellurite resistance protein